MSWCSLGLLLSICQPDRHLGSDCQQCQYPCICTLLVQAAVSLNLVIYLKEGSTSIALLLLLLLLLFLAVS